MLCRELQHMQPLAGLEPATLEGYFPSPRLYQLSYSSISGGRERRQEEPRRQEKEARGMRSPQVYYLTFKFNFRSNWSVFLKNFLERNYLLLLLGLSVSPAI